MPTPAARPRRVDAGIGTAGVNGRLAERAGILFSGGRGGCAGAAVCTFDGRPACAHIARKRQQAADVGTGATRGGQIVLTRRGGLDFVVDLQETRTTMPMHPMSRRQLLLAVAMATTGLPALAQGGAPLKILVGFPPGGGTDAIARILAEGLKDELGTTVIVENKPGAGGQLAAQALKAAPADGRTVFLSHDHTISILPQVVKSPGFDPARDFAAVAGFATFVNAFAVSGGTPARSMAEYVAWVRGTGGGKGAVGIPAPASVPEFLVKMLAEHHKLDLVAAPYRGSAPMMADMLGNQIAAGVGSVPDFIENHKSGKLHVIGVLGGARQEVMPDVPTFAELGLKGFEDVPYYGLWAPAGTPRAAVDPLSAAVARVIARPAVKERLTAMGLAVGHMSPDRLAERERTYTATWARIIARTGFVPQ
jgi:tripartite-type tricarboxylate transporter receptor subunit TctC